MREDWRRTDRWHRRTSTTTGFARVAGDYPDTPANKELLAGHLAHHLPFYERLRTARLPVAGARPA